jgi:hypothetical protein
VVAGNDPAVRTYERVRWLHNNPDFPIWIYSELDAERWETRKVEIFADGRIGYADQAEEIGGTGLSVEPLPPLGKIAGDPQFAVDVISSDEFERIWDDRCASKV